MYHSSNTSTKSCNLKVDMCLAGERRIDMILRHRPILRTDNWDTLFTHKQYNYSG